MHRAFVTKFSVSYHVTEVHDPMTRGHDLAAAFGAHITSSTLMTDDSPRWTRQCGNDRFLLGLPTKMGYSFNYKQVIRVRLVDSWQLCCAVLCCQADVWVLGSVLWFLGGLHCGNFLSLHNWTVHHSANARLREPVKLRCTCVYLFFCVVMPLQIM